MEKKNRGSNFTPSEINLLIQCLKPELMIIENKKTDGATVRDKNNSWQRVTTAFNSRNNEIYRDINYLKMKYENIKKTIKKKITTQKQNCMGTGGGPHTTIKLLWYEELLYSLIQLGVDGLPSVGDSDIGPLDHTYSSDGQTEEVVDYLSDDSHNKENRSSQEDIAFDDDPESDLMQSSSGICTPAENNEDIPSVDIPVRTPLSSNRWNLRKRQRTTVTADQKKRSVDTFQKLTESKITLTKTQEECYKIELQLKKEEASQKMEEWEIKKKILEIELKLKEEQYSAVAEERQRKKQTFELVQEEQKLKIDLLKCELNAKLSQNVTLGFPK